MTRVLSELLGASEPTFHESLVRLEAVSGHQGTDIRLTSEIERGMRQKLRSLGLDPNDTTGTELYAMLEQKVLADDDLLKRHLIHEYGSGTSLSARIVRKLQELPIPKGSFALKPAVGRRILKKLPPKRTMKALGYRSFDSMMRREQLVSVFAGAWLLESASWRKSIVDNYRRLSGNDFELRSLTILAPESKHWQQLAAEIVRQKKNNIVGLKEFGVVVLLPLPPELPPAATLTTLLLALQEMNEVRAASTYLKLCQVQPDFGRLLQSVMTDEPVLQTQFLDGPIPWQVIQRYYARYADRFRAELFEPHIQREDLSWHSVERALSYIEPGLGFWQHTASLGMDDEHGPVSLNVIDACLNCCNQLPYDRRVVHYFRTNLGHELIIRYLKHESVEQMVLDSLEARLVPELDVV